MQGPVGFFYFYFCKDLNFWCWVGGYNFTLFFILFTQHSTNLKNYNFAGLIHVTIKFTILLNAPLMI